MLAKAGNGAGPVFKSGSYLLSTNSPDNARTLIMVQCIKESRRIGGSVGPSLGSLTRGTEGDFTHTGRRNLRRDTGELGWTHSEKSWLTLPVKSL